MAGSRLIANNAAAMAVPTTLKTLIRLRAPTDTNIFLNHAAVYFDGQAAAVPKCLVEVVRTVPGGTATNTDVVPNKVRKNDPATPRSKYDDVFTGEPTLTNAKVIKRMLIHPQGDKTIPLNFLLDAGDDIAIRISSPNAVNAYGHFDFEE